MSGTRRYRKLSAETLGTYYVKCAHCGYRTGCAQSATKGEIRGLTQAATDRKELP